MNASFSSISHWLEAPTDTQPALASNLDAEIVVIGGGYTGLSAALRLRQLGRNVALLEQEFCGYGASGRNAGHLTPTIGKDVFSCIRYFGEKRGLDLIRFGECAVEFVEHKIEELGIKCDYSPSGNIIAGMHPDQKPKLEKAADIARAHNVKTVFLDEQEMRTRRLPDTFLFGVHETTGGHLDPGKYVQGLRKAAIEAGVELYEKTKVENLEPGSPIRITSNSHCVTAKKVLLATNAFTPSTLRLFQSRLAPLAVSQFATEPLSPAQMDRIGWTGAEGVYTAHESLENYRRTADNRIVGGSKHVRYGYGGALPPAEHPDTFKKIDAMFRARFPELSDVVINTHWSGWIALVLDFLPICGAVKGQPNLFYSMGYNGHGVAHASFMGDAIADRMAGVENDALEVLARNVMPLPPEPFRWLAVNGLLSVLNSSDKRTDKKIASLTPTN